MEWDKVGFNLVIEYLLISTRAEDAATNAPLTQMFQSRNRESSNFNPDITQFGGTYTQASFNLVIENLLISTVGLPNFSNDADSCFNLVIENLLISTLILNAALTSFENGIVSIS